MVGAVTAEHRNVVSPVTDAEVRRREPLEAESAGECDRPRPDVGSSILGEQVVAEEQHVDVVALGGTTVTVDDAKASGSTPSRSLQ